MLDRLYRALLAAAYEGDRTPTAGQPEIAVIHGRVGDKAQPNWDAAGAHLTAAQACRAAGDLHGTLAHQRAALAHTAPLPDLLLHNAATLIEMRAYKVAAMLMRYGLRLQPKNRGFHNHLAHACWAQDRGEGIAQCRAMITQFPDDPALVETAVLMAIEIGDAVQACDWGLAYITRGPAPATLLVQIARAMVRAGREAPYELTEQLTRNLDNEGCQAALEMLAVAQKAHLCWRALVAGQPATSLEASAAALDLLAGALPPPPIFSLNDQALETRLGYAVSVPDALDRDGFSLAPTKSVRERGALTTDGEYRRALTNAALKLQLRTLREGFVKLHSPFGGIITSRTPTILHYTPSERHYGSATAYFFEVPRPLFAIIVGEEQWPVAWYDPLSETVLRHPAMIIYDQYIQARIADLKRVWLDDPKGITRYIAGNDFPRTKISLLVGMMEFISTYTFSDLAGLEAIVTADLTEQVSELVLSFTSPFGSLGNLFPELAAVPIVESMASSIIELNASLRDGNRMPLRIAGGFVELRTAARIASWAEAHVDPEIAAELTILQRSERCILLLSLRAHGRRWLNDPHTIAAMIERLNVQVRPLALLIDGYSTGPGATPAALAREANANQRLVSALPSDLPVLTIAGRSLATAITAAGACDLHLSAQGTTTTKPVLIAGKPGVIVGPRQFGWDVRAFRDDLPPQITPWSASDDVVDGDIQSDFFLEPIHVERALADLLVTLPKVRTH